MQKTYVRDLRVGDKVLKFDRSWLGTDFLTHRFVIKDQSVIEKLISNGIEYVFIEPREPEHAKFEELFEGNAEEIMEEIRQEAPKNMIDIKELHKASAVYTESVKVVGDVLQDARKGNTFNFGAIKSIAENITKVTMKNRGVLTSVTKLKQYDDYTYHHSMNVSIYAAILASHLGYNERDIERIANAGLVHDIGKMMIPEHILNKPGKLTAEEYSVMKEHVMRGYDYLLKQGISKDDLHLVLEHHERHDGSGYPQGLSDSQITMDGKIGAVVDIYDAITSDRVYHKGMLATSALKLMFQWADSYINKNVFEFFIKNVGIYPVGSLVMMSTHELAVVGRINNNKPTDPVVIVFMNKQGDSLPMKVIDLSKSALDRQKILCLVNPESIKIPSDVYKYIDGLNRIQ